MLLGFFMVTMKRLLLVPVRSHGPPKIVENTFFAFFALISRSCILETRRVLMISLVEVVRQTNVS